MKWWLCFCAALLAGCGNIPRDPEGTLDRVRAEGLFRVGIIASGAERMNPGRERAFLEQVAKATGARPVLVPGASEPLLEDLEHGRVDLVVGELSPDSPWAKRVAILPPIGLKSEGEKQVALSAMARNGENAWIVLLERSGRRITASLR